MNLDTYWTVAPLILTTAGAVVTGIRVVAHPRPTPEGRRVIEASRQEDWPAVTGILDTLSMHCSRSTLSILE